MRADKEKAVPSEEAEKIFALVTGRRRPEDIRKAYEVLRAMFGKMADEMLLSSTRVAPERLRERGFHFEHPELEPALRALLG